MNKIILVDVDGVLADFTGAVREWDLFALYPEDLQSMIKRRISDPGFCAELKVLPGAEEGVRELVQLGDVYAVTSPWWSSPTWPYERTRWLDRWFGMPADRVVQTSAKQLVFGDVMIDDRPENLIEWRSCQQARGWCTRAVLVDAPYNQGRAELAHRAHGWGDVVEKTREWLAQ
jgi:5'(3')-deoxyribonucleotidase